MNMSVNWLLITLALYNSHQRKKKYVVTGSDPHQDLFRGKMSAQALPFPLLCDFSELSVNAQDGFLELD